MKMDSPVVTISEGKVRGCSRTDLEGKQFFSFLAIPYAKPPVGKLRFKAPQPIEAWNGIKDCTKAGKCCPQEGGFVNNTVERSEDCLQLNVFTKTLPQQDSTLKPVMVWIHGGGFILGSNDINFYGPEYIITKDVVLVSINYRLGFFGFLVLEDPSLEVPGNAALKDQVLALKWVQKNIKSFNGDPNNVTIFGESAGSASVHYLILSPSAKGLFHQAILQSGAVLNPWAGSTLNTLEFMEFIGRKVKDEQAALEILLEMTADELLLLQNKYLDSAGSASVHYLILSPSAKGLFHQAILQSGAVLNPWAGSTLNTLEFMEFIGRKVKDEQAALEILLEMTADELLLLQNKYLDTKPLFFVAGPVIEKSNPTAFLTKSPLEIMISGEYNQVPIMIGYTSNEGLVLLSDLFKRNQTEPLEKKPNMEYFIPPEMKVEKGSPTSELICKKLEDFYSQEENAKNPFMLATDYFIAVGAIGSAKIHSKTSQHPVYLYKMTVETNLNLFKKWFKMENYPGACHCDDLGYLFKVSDAPEPQFGEVEKVCLQQFLKLWTNFAKYGNPTPNGNDLKIQWKPVDGENVNFLDIGRELTMGTNPEGDRINLWRDIYQLSPATAQYL